MYIQDPLLPSIYISCYQSHINHTNISPPIYGTGDGIFLSCVKTMSIILYQRSCFVIILCHKGRILFTCGWFHYIYFQPKSLRFLLHIFEILWDHGEDLVALEHFFLHYHVTTIWYLYPIPYILFLAVVGPIVISFHPGVYTHEMI